jgi:hypothetical protein
MAGAASDKAPHCRYEWQWMWNGRNEIAGSGE